MIGWPRRSTVGRLMDGPLLHGRYHPPTPLKTQKSGDPKPDRILRFQVPQPISSIQTSRSGYFAATTQYVPAKAALCVQTDLFNPFFQLRPISRPGRFLKSGAVGRSLGGVGRSERTSGTAIHHPDSPKPHESMAVESNWPTGESQPAPANITMPDIV